MYYLGIDLGGTNIVAGVVNSQNKIVSKADCPTACPRPANEIIDDMCKMAREAVKKANLTMDDVKWIGIGTPGTVNQETGMVEFAGNLKFKMVPLRQMMEERMGKKIYIQNDANAAAYGEAIAGAAMGTRNSIAITLGTGVGGGIVIDGKIYTGFNYAGAELGHIVIVKDGVQCTCGRRGCWEAYASASALIRQTKIAMIENPDSVMWKLVDNDINKVNGKTAFDAMRADDEAGKKVVDNFVGYVACGLTDVINIFQPDIVCIGGGICKEGETLLEPIREYIRRERFSRFAEKQTRLVRAKLGNDAGVIGAAMLGKMDE